MKKLLLLIALCFILYPAPSAHAEYVILFNPTCAEWLSYVDDVAAQTGGDPVMRNAAIVQRLFYLTGVLNTFQFIQDEYVPAADRISFPFTVGEYQTEIDIMCYRKKHRNSKVQLMLFLANINLKGE